MTQTRAIVSCKSVKVCKKPDIAKDKLTYVSEPEEVHSPKVSVSSDKLPAGIEFGFTLVVGRQRLQFHGCEIKRKSQLPFQWLFHYYIWLLNPATTVLVMVPLLVMYWSHLLGLTSSVTIS